MGGGRRIRPCRGLEEVEGRAGETEEAEHVTDSCLKIIIDRKEPASGRGKGIPGFF